MNKTAMEVLGLSKTYKRTGLPVYRNLREDIRLWWKRLKGVFGRQQTGTFHALQNIRFSLEKGDVLGVIGRNGAGKSTLLKILAGIVKPDSGTVTYQGRLVSILELGVGFHPDLTGRENVFLNGMLLGIPRKNIEQRFDEIVSFSELGGAIEEPVKHYSSGMYLRLAFSVFTHFEADILLLDEVMAVGDLAFRQKSHRQISTLANTGTTIIIVSHDPEQIKGLCNKCLWIESGEVAAFGTPSEVVDAYIEKCFFKEGGILQESDMLMERHQTTWGKGLRIMDEIVMLRFSCKAADKTIDAEITTSDDIEIVMEFQKLHDDHAIDLGISILSLYGAWVLADSSGMYTKFDGVVRRSGTYIARCIVPAGRINFGIYQLGLLISREEALIYQDQALLNLKIRYEDAPGVKGHLAGHAGSLVKPPGIWDIQYLT
ncbi:MAG: ATP-binding cassette domain-containing protein [Lewinellaceae bacterium]|nr:ATP-binding cassette domain-containing protein [Lewinellaceae bacterium]